jgi:oxaloacetate decarboxylase alpha subunit
MGAIKLVDCTFRDAHQSLWGDRMNTAMMYKIADVMDRVGFKAMDVSGAGHFTFALRYLREDPWERIRLLSRVVLNTPLSVMMLGTSLDVFGLTKGPIMETWMKRLFANGVRRVQIMEASNNMTDLAEIVRIAREAGLESAVALVYSHSPIHTDEYYATRARDAAKLHPDLIFLKDSGGLLNPERTKTLVSAIQENANGIDLEFHSHCTTGLAPLCYLEAMRQGIKTFHTATRPLANGSSLPSTEGTFRNAFHMGYLSNLDESAVRATAKHFSEVAQAEGFPTGVPLEYDSFQYEHQVPGGVISNLTRQLSELGLSDRLEEILYETVRVRKELGYPIMVTPFSQFVVTQAVLNVAQGERYKVITDQVILFALGRYGKQPVPVDPEVMDKIDRLPRTREFIHWSPPETSLRSLRRDFGNHYSDDDLLLIALSSEEDLKATRSAGPYKMQYRSKETSVAGFIKEILKQSASSRFVRSQTTGVSLTLSKRS